MLKRSWLGLLQRRLPRTPRRRDNARQIRSAEVLEDRTLLAGTTFVQTGGLSADTLITAASPTSNFGTSPTLEADGSPDIATLFRLDLSSVPRNSLVQSVEITFSVTTTSTSTYEIYELLKPFQETQATFNQAAIGSSWQIVGANGASDRGTTILGTITPTAVGQNTLVLNAAGVAVVQSWVNNPTANKGFIIADYNNIVGDAKFRSREDATVSNRPSFQITFTNESPTAVDDAYQIYRGETLEADNQEIDGVLMNDTDPENTSLSAVLVSGPSHGTLSLQPNGKFVYTHNGDSATSDSFTYRASDGLNLSNIATAAFTINTPPPVNQAPVVDAGPNRIISLGQTAILDGTVTDDGLPNPPGGLGYFWIKVSGPGTVGFSNTNTVDTTATFSAAGSYVLQLTASDGALASSDTVTVTVNAPANQAPTVDAGPNRTINLGQSAALDGTVTDDSLPNPPALLTYSWVKVSGPGTVNFANAAAVDTTATFGLAGTYVLELTASDGALSSSDTMTVTVNAATNQAPVVNAGPDRTISLGEAASLDGTVTDDGLPNPPGALTYSWTISSGPGTVTFANAALVDTTATFSVEGTYVLRLTASDGSLSGSDLMTVTVATAINQAPIVSAGPDRSIAIGQSALLDGTVTDDGLPNPPGSLSYSWTKASGPGTVTFANAAAVDTSATFSATGTYVLSLTASDGSLSASDTMTVIVGTNPTNQAPLVEAGPNATVGVDQTYILTGIVIDDGLPNPPGTLTYLWSRVSGPSNRWIAFTSPTSPITEVGFDRTGTYVLRLTASDGALSSSDTVTITVTSTPTNNAPVVEAGPNRTVALGQSASLDGTVTDDGLPNPPGAVTYSWTKSSGPGTVTFANAAAVDTTATFSVAGTYVLQLSASDGSLSRSDTMTVTVTSSSNLAPTVDAGPDRIISTGQSAVLDGTVTDDGLPNPPGTVTHLWTKLSGPGTVNFSSATAVDTTATFSTAGAYVLQLTANDGEFSSSDTMTVTVNAPTNQAPIVDAGANRSIFIASAASLNGTVTDDGLPNPPGALTYAWTKFSGPGTVTFANAAAVDTSATFSTIGTYVLRLTASDGTLASSDTMTVTVSDTLTSTAGIWISQVEIMSLPTSGTAWTNLVSAASGSIGIPFLADQDDKSDTTALAKALVGVRTSNETYKDQVRNAIIDAMETENGGETLALGRNLASFVIAADLVGLTPEQDATFRAWLSQVIHENLAGRTLVSTFEDRPNNWGTMAGGSLAAVAIYLGDQQLLARVAQVFKGWVGDRSSYASFKFGDLSWQADPSKPVAINPLGATKDGYSIDGALPEEMRRGGSFQFPPQFTGYPWEALQGAFVQAEILYRAGYTDVYQWQDQALLRAVQFLYSIGWDAVGDDQWIPWIIDARYGTSYATTANVSAGKIMGWTSWTHQFANLRVEPSGQGIPASSGTVPLLTTTQLQTIADEAVRRIVQATNSETETLLASVNLEIVDLPGGILGRTIGNTIYIDQNAAGFGWFIDATPGDDSEFASISGTYQLVAAANGPAAGSVDLLTTVMHEFGHVLGYEHSPDHGTMEESLAVGVRQLWNADDLDEEQVTAWAHHTDHLNALDTFFREALRYHHDRIEAFPAATDFIRQRPFWWRLRRFWQHDDV